MDLEFKKNVNLAPCTTFKIGGPAAYFYEASNLEQIIWAVNSAREKKLPIFILGGGSNLLISDSGFQGLVIKIQNSELNVKVLDSGIEIFCEAGIPLSRLVVEAMKIGAVGLEWAMGIPGTVGGAICGNAGAYGHSTGESLLEVKVLELGTGQVKTISKDDCQFAYRESKFKSSKVIIISAIFQLSKGNLKSSQEAIKEIALVRKNKIPGQPSAGSVFKNIEINKETLALLDIIPKEAIKGTKIPAGYLIEQCGLKGKIVGGAQISEQHANFIVNINNAKAIDVVQLINMIKERILDKFKINLEEEIRYLGFEN